MYDCAIIGTGPAGLSAALTLKIHGKDILWIGSRELSSKISKAEKIMNYPGFSGVSGTELAAAFRSQADEAGLVITEAMVSVIYPTGDHYTLAADADFYEAKTVILATGVAPASLLPGENENLGRGVSYCATCDGMLYRGKTIAVICGSGRFMHEVEFLAGIAEKTYVYRAFTADGELPAGCEVLTSRVESVLGDGGVTGIRLADGSELRVDGIFVLREAVALGSLIPALGTENGHIPVDRACRTNLPGCFAAGDCTGRPYQYAKAVGEGNVAAHGVIEYLAEQKPNT